MKVLSILIPVYKTERYLRRCLDSVLESINKERNQDKIEIILVDDGSPDNSGAICDEYVKLCPNCISVYHKKNEGTGATRNFLLEKANGEYIWFVDSDDTITENALQDVLSLIDSHNGIDEISFRLRRFVVDGEYGPMEKAPLTKGVMTGRDYLLSKQFNGFMCNKIYRLKFLNDNNIRFNPNMISQEDSIFNLRVFVYSKNILITDILVYNYFQGNPNSTLQNKSKDYSDRKINDSILAEKGMLRIKNEISDISLKEAVGKILSLHIAGFLHAAYITKVPVKKINNIINELMSSNLYPSKLSGNIKANIFLMIANLKIVFLFICWLHNKKCMGKGINLI